MKYIYSSLFLLVLFSSCTQKVYERFIHEAPYDAIIVPGVPFENGEWDKVMKIRVYWSSQLFKSGKCKNIIFSGSAVYTPYVESKIMALYAEKLGVPKANIYTEEKAEHSTENLYYSMKKAEELGFKKVAIATDPYQSYFLKKFSKRKDWDMSFLPIQLKSFKKVEKPDVKIDPVSAFVANFIPLPEREGVLKRFGGTLGKEIEY